MPPTEAQKREAIEAASKAAGAFIVATRSFDLKNIEREHWLRLVRLIAETYAKTLACREEPEVEDDIPF